MEITRKSSILEILENYPQAQKVLDEYNLECARCLKLRTEDLESAARAHEIEIEELVARLKQLEEINHDQMS